MSAQSLRWVAAVVVGCLVLGFGIFKVRKPGPERRATEFRHAVDRRDWARLYALVPQREREVNRWSQNAVVSLFNSLAAELPSDVGALVLDDITSYEPGSTDHAGPRSTRAYFGYFANGPRDGQGQPEKFRTVARRDVDGHWYLDIAPLALYVNKSVGGTRLEKLQRLHDALAGAGLHKIATIDRDQQVTVAALKAALSGQADPTNVTTPLTRD
jgi:hypothetical protein